MECAAGYTEFDNELVRQVIQKITVEDAETIRIHFRLPSLTSITRAEKVLNHCPVQVLYLDILESDNQAFAYPRYARTVVLLRPCSFLRQSLFM